MKRVRILINWMSLGLVAAAIYQELKKQPEERTWHGKVFGFIPYEFRPPTFERILNAYWNPQVQTIFTDTVFGVGWAINLYSVFRRVRQLQTATQSK